MPQETRPSHSVTEGFTLVELMLATSLVAVVSGSILGFMIHAHDDFTLVSQRSDLLHEGQAAVAQMVRTLRQAQSFTRIVCTSGPAEVQYVAPDGAIRIFRHNPTAGTLEYGSVTSIGEMASGVVSLSLTCTDDQGQTLADPVFCPRVRSLEIHVQLTNPANPAVPIELSDCLFWRKDIQRVAINEILCNPVGLLNEDSGEWIEIYNPTRLPIDLTGWQVWTHDASNADALISHPLAGNGSLLLPAWGYAVVSARNSDLYSNRVSGGDFESTGLPGWIQQGVWTLSTAAHGGQYAAAFSASGTGEIRQAFTVSSSIQSCLLTFWERTTAALARTSLTATICNSGGTVLATVYSGRMHGAWTSHTIDLTAYAGQSLQIHLAVSKTTTAGVLLMDDIAAIASAVPVAALRLAISGADDRIGGGLDDDSDTVCLTEGTVSVDTVMYTSAWGLSGEGTTLARLSADQSADSQKNWSQGPAPGTPGQAN